MALAACEPEAPVTPALELTVSIDALSVPATDATGSFTVTCNQQWTASADAEWVKFSPEFGVASDKAVTVSVTAEDNPANKERSAKISVKAGEETKTVTVTQAANEAAVEEEGDQNGEENGDENGDQSGDENGDQPDDENGDQPGDENGDQPDGEMPQIPAEYVSETLWEGSQDLTWDAGLQALAYGAYNWAQRKPGEYLKIYITATDPAAEWMLGVLYAAENVWNKFSNLPDSYYQPEGGIVVIELTEEMISLLSSPNQGLILHGQNITVTKIEAYYKEGSNDVQVSDNILVNGDFENGAEGWMGWDWCDYTYDSDEGHEGGSSIVLTLGTSANLWDMQIKQSGFTIAPGTYAYEFYAKTDKAPHTVQLFAQEDVNYKGAYGSNHNLTTEWARYSGQIVFTAGEIEGVQVDELNSIGIQFGQAGSENAKIWFDDVKFAPVN